MYMVQKDMQKYKQSFDYKVERFANKATNFVGSPMSLILHTILFIAAFLLIIFGIDRNTVLLVLTTIVSLEAIYLSLFIQMSVNRSNRRLSIVKKELDVIQENIDEIQEDVEGIEKDVDELAEDIDEDEVADRARDEMIIQSLEGAVTKMMQELEILKYQN